MAHQQTLGAKGEALAVQFLKREGYSIVATNWHCRYGEIDIVARMNQTWVFVEVKTRQAMTTDTAFAGITAAKQKKFVKAVHLYLAEHKLDDVIWRVDAMAIALPRSRQPIIEHVEDALDW